VDKRKYPCCRAHRARQRRIHEQKFFSFEDYMLFYSRKHEKNDKRSTSSAKKQCFSDTRVRSATTSSHTHENTINFSSQGTHYAQKRNTKLTCIQKTEKKISKIQFSILKKTRKKKFQIFSHLNFANRSDKIFSCLSVSVQHSDRMAY